MVRPHRAVAVKVPDLGRRAAGRTSMVPPAGPSTATMGAGMGVLRSVDGTRTGPGQRVRGVRLPGGARGMRIRGGPALAGAASAAFARVDQPTPVPDRTAGAFFDVDNTLMRAASIYYFARGLAARKMFGPRDLAEMAWKQVYFRLRGAEHSGHIDAAREAALAFVA